MNNRVILKVIGWLFFILVCIIFGVSLGIRMMGWETNG